MKESAISTPRPTSDVTVEEIDRIRKTPGVCGGEACIRDTRITVRGLVEWHQQGLSDA